jgi:uncharacterized YigZ family protein
MMDEDLFRTIAGPSEGNFKSKGSHFYSFAFPVDDVEKIKIHLLELKAKYHDAQHHCYAYVLGAKADKFRANDDREPPGTAGKPILGQINSFKLTNVMISVIRYFGGTLLGTGGLVEAYKSAAHSALSNSVIIERTEDKAFRITFDYIVMNDLLHIIREEKATILSKEFMESGSMQLAIRLSKAKQFVEKLNRVKGITILE